MISVAQVDTSFEEITAGLMDELFSSSIKDVERAAAVFASGFAPVVSQHRLDTLRGFGFDSIAEGRSFRAAVSPGTIELMVTDTNKDEKLLARQEQAARRLADTEQMIIDDIVEYVDIMTGELYCEPKLRDQIKEWSKKSRMRMVKTLAQLDYSDWVLTGGVLAMVTLTLPGEWESVAPTGKHFKNMIKKFEKRWTRSIGPWKNLWKLEFQGRGAAHFHMLTMIPALVDGVRFEQWVSKAWADCVAHPDPVEYAKHLSAGTGVDYSGSSYSDPRRIALYFLGHSAKTQDGKEYQHIVPELWQAAGAGPGRFWGAPGFKKALVMMEISMKDFYTLARQLRKLKKSRDWSTGLKRMRGYAVKYGVEPISAVDVRWRKDKTMALGNGGSFRGGWVLLNDALTVAEKLGKWMKD